MPGDTFICERGGARREYEFFRDLVGQLRPEQYENTARQC